MDDLIHLLFLVNIALLNAHELDAIQQHEWRFFPFLRPFSDVTAYRIFVAAHVPLLVLILANLESRPFQIGLDLFGHFGGEEFGRRLARIDRVVDRPGIDRGRSRSGALARQQRPAQIGREIGGGLLFGERQIIWLGQFFEFGLDFLVGPLCRGPRDEA